ncbi:MAG: NAD-dependent DNA ligase LigA [Lachnospiraceae bacterium]|nr:NAD-dependent DNA ligase LigA [Lachnospiraceae bacterium]
MENSKAIARMKELVETLREASKAYYAEDREIMSNYEYDKLYDELVALEEETGMVLAGSPTISVGYEAVDELPKEAHESPMLSLGKTKDREELREWLKDKEGLLSWKLDGLTIVLTYQNGELLKAVTRGNGEVGEVITNNARVFKNIPLRIQYQGELILRGEAVITYSDFEEINSQIEDVDSKYKNPRNLCSGSVRQLNNEITAARNVRFYAFSLVKAEGVDVENSREKQFLFLKQQGFDVVDYAKVDASNIVEAIADYEKRVENYNIPSDGLVLTYDDIEYGRSLGRTAKFPRDSIAFKWADEIRETILKEIEWSPSRTGLINPVAIFEPVELEGTTVSRASVHNVSILRALKLGIGDTITVYKANMIIPQIAENLTGSDTVEIPCICPVCGGNTQIQAINDVQSLYCMNPDCDAKKLKSFSLFVSRDAMNIDGMSEATLEKFLAKGFIHEYQDMFHLDRYCDEIIEMEGFGEKSYQKLITSIEQARKVTLPKLIFSLGIANIGLANAKVICRYFKNDLDAMRHADVEELSQIDGIGEVIAKAFVDYFAKEENSVRFDHLLTEVEIEQEEIDEAGQTLEGKVFVVTGSLEHFGSRNELKDLIEKKGGKVTGSVTSRTDCLINNDIASNSSKNKKAKELQIPIVTEEEFMTQYLGMEI